MAIRRSGGSVKWRDLFPGLSPAQLATVDPSTDLGVTDHGALTGLADDDHPQYHNNARGDVRYMQLGSGVTAHSALTGLGADDHTQYLNNTRGDVRYFTKTQSRSYIDWQLPTGVKAISMPRIGTFSTTLAALTSGRLLLVGIPLREGDSISSLTFISGTTALATGTNHWFALYDQSLALLRQTADQGAAAWAANTIKTLNLSSAHVATYTGLHYAGIMVAATTVPTLLGMNGNATLNGLRTPVLVGASTTGLTTTAPATAAALSTTVSTLPYCEAA